MAMLPHERSLVKRLADKPFALLGVSFDHKETYVEAVAKEPVSFRSWLDDDDNPVRGPIATKWNVTTLPTLYLLDRQGIIRFKWLGVPANHELDDAIDSLIDKVPTKTD